MEHRTPKELVAAYLAAYNAFDIEGMLGLVSDDVRFENHSGGALTAQASGRDALRALAEQSKALFAQREQRVTRWDIGDDAVSVAIDYTGRLARDIPGGPAAGTVIALKGASEFGFADGKIARIVDRS